MIVNQKEEADEDVRLNESDLADRMQVTVKTVQKWRREGKGPAYLKLASGSVRYRLEDVLAYEESCLVLPKNNQQK